MSMLIHTHYKPGKPEKRGTLDGANFYRDNTPYVWDRFIALELDVIERLNQLGCKRCIFRMRDGQEFVVTMEDWDKAVAKNTGVPDKRLQKMFDTKRRQVDTADQPDLFKEVV